MELNKLIKLNDLPTIKPEELYKINYIDMDKLEYTAAVEDGVISDTDRPFYFVMKDSNLDVYRAINAGQFQWYIFKHIREALPYKTTTALKRACTFFILALLTREDNSYRWYIDIHKGFTSGILESSLINYRLNITLQDGLSISEYRFQHRIVRFEEEVNDKMNTSIAYTKKLNSRIIPKVNSIVDKMLNAYKKKHSL